ncbi:semaphorin-4E-like [Nelusetta ayraudi]|uniref:semaphorin-4E-like n=1 Tax=Nelusetta ayraudi TaxID=303726 RepID=UPI003F71F1D3
MSLLSALSLLCGLMLHGSLSTSNSSVPQQQLTDSHHNELKSFSEHEIFHYTTMLIREDLGVLLLGAREAIYALDLNNISVKKSAVYWPVTQGRHSDCVNAKIDEGKCRNYIRTLHKLNETTMYVCGTNAFNPTCDYMTFADGLLSLKGKQLQGDEYCPNDPFKNFSSLMVGSDLYSATSAYILKVNVSEHEHNTAKYVSNERISDPTFVHMKFVGESFESQDGDDDKIYLFFSENAKEYHSKVVVSRVARVCKGDMGGKQMLRNRWTSFLEARLDCSPSEANPSPIVQDVFLLENNDWRKSVFYAVFTPQSSLSQTSFVCAYSVSAIRDVFNEGKFKTPNAKSVVPAKKVPVPRPGACIGNVARDMGITSSLDLPKKTLTFIKDHPLMDEAVQPMTGGPLLVVKGPLLTRIVVDCIMALDGQNYTVMFVGTGNGYINKAVNYDGEMFIIEEIQLYEESVPISTLHLSESKGQIYAGSVFGAFQMPVSNCSRHATCVDCVLARDPYCAWDLATKQCSSVTGVSNTALQSLKEGDSTQCPQPDPVVSVNLVLVPGNNIQLLCQTHSNLAQMHWRHSGQILRPDDKYYFSDWGLLIIGASTLDAGQYICDSVEKATGRISNRTVASYELTTTMNQKTELISNGDFDNQSAKHHHDTVIILVVSVSLLSLACFSLFVMVILNWRKGRLRFFSLAQSARQSQGKRQSEKYMHVQNRSSKTSWQGLPSVRPLKATNHAPVYLKWMRGQSSTQTPNISALHGPGCINETGI